MYFVDQGVQFFSRLCRCEIAVEAHRKWPTTWHQGIHFETIPSHVPESALSNAEKKKASCTQMWQTTTTSIITQHTSANC
jgi:hypothetical protein